MIMLAVLEKRFRSHMDRHPDLTWERVEKRLTANGAALSILQKMEDTGGEPDAIGLSDDGEMIAFCDCAPETPAGRRSLCYDDAARRARTKTPPRGSALAQAQEMGVTLMDERLYRRLQTLGEFDRKTSSWIATPEEIRRRGGALFCERRYGTVFTFHNGAESYYSVRGWRGYLLV